MSTGKAALIDQITY